MLYPSNYSIILLSSPHHFLQPINLGQVRDNDLRFWTAAKRLLDVSLDTFNLNCFIIDGPADAESVFTINIPKSKNISQLKALIKPLVNISNGVLEIRKSSFPIVDLETKEPKALGPSLGPFKLLSELFPAGPNANQLHILVRLPDKGEYYQMLVIFV